MENVDRSMSVAERRKRSQGGYAEDDGNHNHGKGKGGKGGKGKGKSGGMASMNGKLREQGVIASIKGVYGFIKCVENDDIYFSMSQAPPDIALGDEVDFNVMEKQGKWSAIRLSKIPKGTVKFEEILPGVHKGVVTREMSSVSSFGRRDNGARDGVIKLVDSEESGEPKASEADIFEFTTSNVAKGGTSLCKGDEVEFEVLIELKTRRRRATNIKVIRTALEIELADCPQEDGVICSIKDRFGFIQSTTRESHVYFRFEDVEAGVRIEEGQEVAFISKQEVSRCHGGKGGTEKLRAFRITALPPGTVQFEDLLGSDCKGTVSRSAVLAEGGGRGGRHGARPGRVVVNIADDIKEAVYNTEDVNKKISLRTGDEVTVDLFRHKATGVYFARHISIQQLNPMLREQGVVTSVKTKEGFGFIKACEREDDLYFRLSEYIDSDLSPLEPNIEVEFDVSPGSMGKLHAERIQFLMEGTVWFEAALSTDVHNGEVIREPKGNRHGLVKCVDMPQVDIALEYMDIWRKCEEFRDNDSASEKSKRAELTIPLLSPKQTEVFVKVATKMGIGYKLGGDLTLFKFINDEEKDNFTAPKPRGGLVEPDNHLVFHAHQVEDKEYVAQKGDVVEFKIVMDRRSLRKGVSEVCLKERPAPTMGYDTGDGTVRSLVFTSPRKIRANPDKTMPTTYREASKPDGTLGFAEGWRRELKLKKLVSSEENQTTQNLPDDGL